MLYPFYLFHSTHEYIRHLKDILVNDKERKQYVGSWVSLQLTNVEQSTFNLSNNGIQAIKTSDGCFYSYDKDGQTIVHHWDNSKNLCIDSMASFRYVIYYYSKDSICDNDNCLNHNKYNTLFYVFGLNIHFVSHKNIESIFNSNPSLVTFDFIDCYNIEADNNDWSYFCSSCTNLRELPLSLNTKNGTNFNFFCYYCFELECLPQTLDTSSGVTFNSFCMFCRKMYDIPNLDFRMGKNFDCFFVYCLNLNDKAKKKIEKIAGFEYYENV